MSSLKGSKIMNSYRCPGKVPVVKQRYQKCQRLKLSRPNGHHGGAPEREVRIDKAR